MKSRFLAVSVFVALAAIALLTMFLRAPAEPDTDEVFVAPEIARPVLMVPPDRSGGRPEPADKAVFRELARQVLEDLPRTEAVRRHGVGTNAPRELFEASVGLGKIAQMQQTNPELATEAVSFYRACAGGQDLLTAVRAVCLWNLRHSSSRAGVALSESAFPDEIRRIADALPVTR